MVVVLAVVGGGLAVVCGFSGCGWWLVIGVVGHVVMVLAVVGGGLAVVDGFSGCSWWLVIGAVGLVVVVLAVGLVVVVLAMVGDWCCGPCGDGFGCGGWLMQSSLW